MFITLLLSNFCISLMICLVTALLFSGLVGRYLKGSFGEDSSALWVRYLVFLIYIIGVSVGTRIWEIERYAARPEVGGKTIELTHDLMALEIYKTLLATLQIDAVLLFTFLLVAWIALVMKKKI